jgi:hypothetical protein
MLRYLFLALGYDTASEANIAGTASGGDEFCGEVPCGEVLLNNG